MQDAYRDDLAYIHDAGFGRLAESAAGVLMDELQRSGIRRGTVVELGCGSGISSRRLCAAGYHVVGIDLSESLLRQARQRVPEAVFQRGSWVDANIPPCVAVTAIGEIFNYTFDPANSPAARSNVFQRIYAALEFNGLFLFDLAGPERAPSPNPLRSYAEGADWAVLCEAEADPQHRTLTRRMTTFRQQGAWYRRDFEQHQLQLVDPDGVSQELRRLGFSVATRSNYGSMPLPRGLTAFVARKVIDV